MNQRFDQPRPGRMSRGELPTVYTPSAGKTSRFSIFVLAITCAVIILVLLALGSYSFGWTWTGFKNNTLWDWLKLLLLPVVLTTASVWYTLQQKQLRRG